MKFRCYSCYEEWFIPKEKLVCMGDWPDACSDCGSTHIGHEKVGKVMASSSVLGNVVDKELEEIKREKRENASRR